MKLSGDYLFDAPIQDVWDALFDPVVLAAVMPGCEKLDLVDGAYVGDLNIKVGPVQGKFTGKVDLKDIVEPNSYTMVIDGRGAPGFMKATASVKLATEGAGTRIHYEADAQVGGKIGSVGQRLLEASSRAITKQSLDGLSENIKIRMAAEHAAKAEEAPVAAAPPAAPELEAKATMEDAAAEPEKQEEPVEAPKKVAAPVVLKKVDQNALAASIAKEVTKSVMPSPIVIVVLLAAVAALVWFLTRK